MRRNNAPKKLKLDRETLRQLDQNELGQARGGAGVFPTALCTVQPGQTSIARTIY